MKINDQLEQWHLSTTHGTRPGLLPGIQTDSSSHKCEKRRPQPSQKRYVSLAVLGLYNGMCRIFVWETIIHETMYDL